MAKQLTDKELRQQAVRALTDSLGPVEALRFLALVSRESFDYQEWRREYRAVAWVFVCGRASGLSGRAPLQDRVRCSEWAAGLVG